MKKIKLALLILGISVFASCSGDTVESTGVTEETIEAKLTVIVRDAITGESIDEAEVSLLPSESILAKDGIALFDDVRIGTHTLKIEKPGYASVSATASIARNNIAVNQTEGEYIFTASENTITVLLSPESTNLYGYIYYLNAKGQILPAKDVKVYVEFLGTSLINKLFEAQTNASGKYSFESLPAGIRARAWAVAPESGLDGIKYESFEIGSEILPVGNVYIDEYQFFGQDQNNANFKVNYNSTVAKDSNIVLTFTENIDLNSIEVGKTVRVNAEATLKWGSKALTITPLNEWEDDIEVYLTDLKSKNGKTLSIEEQKITIALKLKDLSSTVVDGLAIISPERINYNATTVDLRWNLVEGATSYDIYRKDDKDTSSYVRVKEYSAIKGATIGNVSVSLGRDDALLNGRIVSFIVRAKNKTSISPLDTSKAVKVIDKIKPTLMTSGDPKCLVFSEPINKTTLSVLPLTDKLETPNDNTVCINQVVTVSTTYAITGIKDLYGNEYGPTGTGIIIISP